MHEAKIELTPVTTLILAGGQSSRMGQDKALLQFHGMPLLRYLIEQTLPISAAVLVVTPWPERYQDIVPSSCHLIRENRPDWAEGQGPLSAFAQGLEAIATPSPVPWILLLACDLPNLTTALLETWITELPTVSLDAIALLPQSAKGWEPLSGFYRPTCLPRLNAFLANGGRSFQAWLRDEVVQALIVSDRSVLLNCNTPEDWVNAIGR